MYSPTGELRKQEHLRIPHTSGIACAVEVRAPPLTPVALPALRLVQYLRRVPYRSKMLAISKKSSFQVRG